MLAFSLPADLPEIIRSLERDALALVASMPAEAVRLVLLASELRGRARP